MHWFASKRVAATRVCRTKSRPLTCAISIKNIADVKKAYSNTQVLNIAIRKLHVFMMYCSSQFFDHDWANSDCHQRYGVRGVYTTRPRNVHVTGARDEHNIKTHDQSTIKLLINTFSLGNLTKQSYFRTRSRNWSNVNQKKKTERKS